MKDPLHALWLCPELDVVWSDQSMWGFRYEVGFVTVKELLLWMIDEGKSLELLAFTAWGVWNQRNKARLMLQSSPLHQVAANARTSLVQYQADLQVLEVQVGCSSRGEIDGRHRQIVLLKLTLMEQMLNPQGCLVWEW